MPKNIKDIVTERKKDKKRKKKTKKKYGKEVYTEKRLVDYAVLH
jgi:hypothetical protein